MGERNTKGKFSHNFFLEYIKISIRRKKRMNEVEYEFEWRRSMNEHEHNHIALRILSLLSLVL